jgi:glucose-1-phosphate cytidylyltransferase
MDDPGVQVAILCGGRGTRLRELTTAIPKVLVEIGGKPILWHIMKGYAHHGFREFLLALGYMGSNIAEYVDDVNQREHDGWSVAAIDTGEETNTGGRIAKLRDSIKGDVFFATYGDGLSDVDLVELLAFHRSHGRIATVTVVRPRLTFGLVDIDDDRVSAFTEKPRMDAWINGGFFTFDRRIFDYLADDSVLETGPLPQLAAAGELMAYRHHGFWACMDTYKDNLELNSAWESGEAPWLTWHDDD